MESKNKRDKGLKMTRDEMHIKALSKGVDSQKIKGSMTVVLLGHAVDMMMEMQDQHEAELKAKDERIEAQSSVIIACQNAILQKDERITELEAKLESLRGYCREQIQAYDGPQTDVEYGLYVGYENILNKIE